MLSRKIAKVISETRKLEWVRENDQASTGVDACEEIAEKLADQFQKDDPMFERQRFLAACGFGD